MDATNEADLFYSDVDLLEGFLELLKRRSDAGAITYMSKEGPMAITWGSGGRVYHAARHLANNAAEKFIEEGGEPLMIERGMAMSFLDELRERYLKGGGGIEVDAYESGDMFSSETGHMDGYHLQRVTQDKRTGKKATKTLSK